MRAIAADCAFSIGSLSGVNQTAMLKRLFVIILIAAAICAFVYFRVPRFDTSSDEAFAESSAKIAETLTDEDKEKLAAAFVVIVLAHPNSWKEQIDGKTAQNVIDMGEEITDKVSEASGKFLDTATKGLEDVIQKVIGD